MSCNMADMMEAMNQDMHDTVIASNGRLGWKVVEEVSTRHFKRVVQSIQSREGEEIL